MSHTTPLSRYPVHPWQVTEPALSPADYRLGEAVMALANGYLGQRASFEEGLPGAETLRGNYIAGVFDHYPNPTMVKLKGRPTHPSQIVNIPDYLPVQFIIAGEPVELASCAVESYTRTLHMDRGVLTREVVCATPGGQRLRLAFTRFLSLPRKHLAALRVAVTLLTGEAELEIVSTIDAGVRNLNQRHLTALEMLDEAGGHGVRCRTAGTGIDIAVLAAETIAGGANAWRSEQDGASSRRSCRVLLTRGAECVIEKLVAVADAREPGAADPRATCRAELDAARAAGFAELLREQEAAWAARWRRVAVEIRERADSGALTQGLRYSLFQMMQNAPNNDATVNIGAKGLTGEHYYGTYFWDTEVYMLPLFTFTLPEVARDLVRFRALTLPGARGKAAELDLRGAAYPWMSDSDGNESCTLWQFGLLATHVTADVAWGIWLYYCTSGDLAFIAEGGIDVLVETSRCWLSRVYYRPDLGQYVINKVLGPDEYHQGVDNNFYTNIMAQENLRKCVVLLETLAREMPDAHAAALARLKLTAAEIARFRAVADGMRLPYDATLGVDMQDDGFALLEPYDLRAHPPGGALNAVWSYDRLLRTQLLRQADVLVAHVLLGDRFTREQIARDYDYYEPKTTHDSSLSVCTHSMVAAALGRTDAAYDYFLRTARLDLDDLHGNSWMGIHTACLAGAWQCVVLGFGGVRWYDGHLTLAPVLPAAWDHFTFTLCWHGVVLTVTVSAGTVEMHTDGGEVDVQIGDQHVTVTAAPQSLPIR